MVDDEEILGPHAAERGQHGVGGFEVPWSCLLAMVLILCDC